MPVDPDDILATAESMGQEGEEVHWRNAISRAYYAAFHKSRILAEGIEPQTDFATSTAHQDVPNVIKATHGLKGRQISAMLTNSHKARKRADYDIRQHVERDEGLNAIANSKRILSLVDNL